MIKDVFIPEKIGSYYLFPQRIIGFDIGKTHVYATQLYVQGTSITIEKFFEEHIEADAAMPLVERIGKAITAILKQADKYHIVVSCLSSAVVIFKELTLPFTDEKKIRMVLGFEIESALPFSLSEAVYDFIVTRSTETESTILVAAVQKNYCAEHLRYFAQAGVEPGKITVDLFDIYGLFKSIPEYEKLPGTVALLDMGFYTTRVAFIVNSQLKLLRTLPHGLMKVAKQISSTLSIPNGQAIETLVRFGLEQPSDQKYTTAATEAMKSYWSHVDFTLKAFANQVGQQQINEILLLGEGADIQHCCSFIKTTSALPCNLFDLSYLLKQPHVTLKAHQIPRTHYMSLSTAYPSTITQHFNLRRQEFSPSTTTLFTKQLVTAVVLMLALLGILILHSYWQVSTLKKEAQTSERAVLNHIRSLDLSEAKDLATAIKDSAEKVSNEEDIWFAFSGQTRTSFLKYLQDLSTAIDRESTGLKLKNLTITEHEITIEGEVKNFDALKTFEKELKKSNLFVAVPALQETKFSMKLKLKKLDEEAS